MVKKIIFSGIAMSLLAMSASATSLVQNGAFTTGDFTGWGGSEWAVGAFPSDPGILPTDTAYAALTGCSGASCNDTTDPGLADISQSIGTTDGDTYTLSFLYDAGNAGGVTELDALWDGSIVTGGQIVDAPADTWAQYTFNDLVASSSSTVLEFTGRQDTNLLYLTDISVTDTTPTPEPASLLLIGGGLLGLGTILRRRRTA